MSKYLYDISYTDSREGDLRRVEIIAEDEGDALDEAMEDYYFGKLIDIDERYELDDQRINESDDE